MGPCTANARRPTVVRRCRGTTISCCVADLRRCLPTTSVTGLQQSTRYCGALSSAVWLYGLGETNEAGKQLEDFCLEHECWLWPIPCSNNIQGGCIHGPLLMQHPESERLHLNCAKMENKLDESLHISRSRLRHRSSVACDCNVTAVMAAYRRVYDSHYPQAGCQEPGSAPEPYARQSSRPMG